MSLEEERSLVNAVLAKNHIIGCYVGVLGETALRMTQGLLLKSKFVNLGERNLTVEASKNYKTRHVPLTASPTVALSQRSRHVVDIRAALGHELFDVTQAQGEPQIPTNTSEDDFGLKVASREEGGLARIHSATLKSLPGALQYLDF